MRQHFPFRSAVRLALLVTVASCGSDPTGPTVTFPLSMMAPAAFHTCGLGSGGVVYCWGRNSSGELGDNTTFARLSPAAVGGSVHFQSIVAGHSHTCGLDANGAAWCWGSNESGELGDGTTVNRLVPTLVSGGHVFESIAGGQVHTCGLTAQGAAWCWGSNNAGRLGDGTTTNRPTPVAVIGGLLFDSIELGIAYSCGLTAARLAYCWGYNGQGAVGDGTDTDRLEPAPVTGGLNFVSLGAGVGSHICGVTSLGAVYCWGANSRGQLGNGLTDNTSSVPVRALLNEVAVKVVAGGGETCALIGTGAVWCWGSNGFGQLGTGTTSTESAVPVQVIGGFQFQSLWQSGNSPCALTSSGAAYCWGRNDFGQLGDGSTTHRSSPTRVLDPG